MVTAEQLQEFLGTSDNVDNYLARAELLVARRIGTADVPEVMTDGWTLTVAQNLWQKDHTPTGAINQQYADPTGIGTTGVRASRNPFASIEQEIRGWVPVW